MLGISQIIVLTSPLILVLLSLALMPLIANKFWHKFDIKVMGSLAAISVIATYTLIDSPNTIMEHAIVEDYAPFIIMLFALYVLSHGITIKIKAAPTTRNNLIFLICASVFSSLIGTTGASMLLLRPFLKMNQERTQKSHLVVFFIFMVSNIGGLLTPLGDPPLLLGYLHGIDFFWCSQNLFGMWMFYIASCALVLSVIDKFILFKSKIQFHEIKTSIEVKGYISILLIILTVLILFIEMSMIIKNSILILFSLLSIFSKPNCNIDNSTLTKFVQALSLVSIALVFRKLLKIEFINIDLILCSIIAIMFIKKENHSSKLNIDLEPFKEVAITFFIIFVVMAPVTFILSNFSNDIYQYISSFNNGASNTAHIYFWLCGLASSFLDNAPSYLLFFNMAGGDPHSLMYTYSDTLKAISTSAVVMGAMTYIGNAPNMMVRSVAQKQKIKMPSFLGYMLWSCLVILPLSLLITLVLL